MNICNVTQRSRMTLPVCILEVYFQRQKKMWVMLFFVLFFKAAKRWDTISLMSGHYCIINILKKDKLLLDSLVLFFSTLTLVTFYFFYIFLYVYTLTFSPRYIYIFTDFCPSVPSFILHKRLL